MGRLARTLLWLLVFVISGIAFLVLLPSLIGALIVALLVFTFVDMASRRYRNHVRTLNSTLRAVCDEDGGIDNVALAFSKSGPLSSVCYEYARRLMAGEDAVAAAISSHVPLQLGTAISLYSPAAKEPNKGEGGQGGSNTAENGSAGAERSNLADSREHVWRDLAMIDSVQSPVYGQFLYLAATALVTCLVLAFTSTFIVPTFEQIFEEFGLRLPLQSVFEAAPYVWILFLVVAFALLALPLLNHLRVMGLRLPKWIPVTPRVAERKGELLVGLADGIDMGWPLGRIMSLGHAISRSGLERRSLESAMRLVQQGAEPLQAMHRVGWLDAGEAAWLADATPKRSAQLLREFARQSIRDARENIRWVMAIVFPIVVIGLGIIVMLYAAAFFGSLTSLISELSKYSQ